MNIGTVKRNMNGQLIGQITTIALSLTIGLRPVTSANPKAPKFEIVALNASRQWTNVRRSPSAKLKRQASPSRTGAAAR